MIRKRITTLGNSAAIILSRDLLDLMEIKVGDEVELSLVGRSLVVRPVPETGRKKKVREAVKKVLREDAELLRRLAQEP